MTFQASIVSRIQAIEASEPSLLDGPQGDALRQLVARLEATVKKQQQAEIFKGAVALECPYKEKDEAKAMGARWNASIKKWMVPANLLDRLDRFSKWLPNHSSAAPQPQRRRRRAPLRTGVVTGQELEEAFEEFDKESLKSALDRVTRSRDSIHIKLEAAFALCDQDEDGGISREEMTMWLATVFKERYENQPGTAERMGVSAEELADVTAAGIRGCGLEPRWQDEL